MSDEPIWELFHENSKLTAIQAFAPEFEMLLWMRRLRQSLPFTGYPRVSLPLLDARNDIAIVIASRRSARAFRDGPVTFEQLAAILSAAYGVTERNESGEFPRPFRAAPSAGALYPLELFVYARQITGLDAGLYHYNPDRADLALLRCGIDPSVIRDFIPQHDLALHAAAVIFITAMFERSITKYGDRGYRFALLEAGHAAQNVNLVAASLGLGSANIGGYWDRVVDDWLGLDGLSHGTIYLTLIGTV
jgi:SagB-type dehydrogenase family enzyme